MQELASAKLRGRVLLPGNAVAMTHMGKELLLCCEGADISADAAHGFLIGKDTAVHILLGSESMPQPDEPKPAKVHPVARHINSAHDSKTMHRDGAWSLPLGASRRVYHASLHVHSCKHCARRLACEATVLCLTG